MTLLITELLIHLNNTRTPRWPFCIAALFRMMVCNIKQFYIFQKQLQLCQKSVHLKCFMRTGDYWLVNSVVHFLLYKAKSYSSKHIVKINRLSPDDLADRSPLAVSLFAGSAICFHTMLEKGNKISQIINTL